MPCTSSYHVVLFVFVGRTKHLGLTHWIISLRNIIVFALGLLQKQTEVQKFSTNWIQGSAARDSRLIPSFFFSHALSGFFSSIYLHLVSAGFNGWENETGLKILTPQLSRNEWEIHITEAFTLYDWSGGQTGNLRFNYLVFFPPK